MDLSCTKDLLRLNKFIGYLQENKQRETLITALQVERSQRRQWELHRDYFTAWQHHVISMGRARKLLSRILLGTLHQSFLDWRYELSHAVQVNSWQSFAITAQVCQCVAWHACSV